MSSILSSTRTLVLCICILVCTGAGKKWTDDRNKKQDPEEKTFPAKKLSSPFEEDVIVSSDNLIIIKAKVDTIEGNFILDTGAPGMILNSTYFRDYKPEDPAVNEQTGGITGAVDALLPTRIKAFSFGGIQWYKLYADRISLGHIENLKGTKILGLLGMQLFKRFEMVIDFKNNLLHFRHIRKNEKKGVSTPVPYDVKTALEMDLMMRGNKILTNGKIGNRKLTFIIDTGAESNVIDARLPGSVLDSVNIQSTMKLNGAGGTKTDALYGDMRNFKIGTLFIHSMPVLVTNLEKMSFVYEKNLDGMLGFDFLSRHQIGFNFVTRKMYIWK
jgi:predicted aspartyl protease